MKTLWADLNSVIPSKDGFGLFGACFSGCGTFTYINRFKMFFFLREVDTTPTIPIVSETELVYNNAMYSFETKKSVLRVEFSRALRPDSGEFGVSSWRMCLSPSSLKAANTMFLFGPGETSRMRVLFLPSKGQPQIRTLQFTFAELSSRLDRLWKGTSWE